MVIENAEKLVKQVFSGDATGHDWYHTDRVRKNALYICEKEGGNPFICELAALLHDVVDEKFNVSEDKAMEDLKTWLDGEGVAEETREEIITCIETVSFKGGNNEDPVSINGRIVQDADRLDAIGAIGVARCFMYAGAKGDPMYMPDTAPRENMTKEQYREKGSAINHFYEKLFKLQTLMKTDTGRQMAKERHEFMESFVQQFLKEWNSENKY
ncbi:MAG: HD domain-containing protein [Bacillus sp. (in: Bacteria)]|nr:HD domain-containing protein [Bacillus sp. (in: firmicutes)]